MIGKTISHYKVLEEIGSGGMGIVYKVEDTDLERYVALKFLPAELTRDKEARERFINEAKSASSLDHPNICNIHEIGQTNDGQIFITMAYYKGETLKDRVARKPLEIEEAIDIAVQIAKGLQKAHEKNITHRDIKPANIFITDDGIVKILDFGLAKLSGQTKLTKAGSTLGTVAYMSPEQTRGDNADYRSDIWSLGVLIYEMITGRLPFKGDYEQAVIYSILNADPTPVGDINQDVSPDLVAIMNACLQKNIQKRYQSLDGFLSDMEVLQQSNSTKKSIKKSLRIKSHRSFHRISIFAGSIIIMIILLFLSISNWTSIKNWIDFSSLPAEKHLAILPFTLIGEDQSKKAFCDGLFETLISKTSQLEYYQKALWVVPATEIRSHEIASPSDVRKKFKEVHLAVSGSLQFDQEELRLTMNLINTEDMQQIDSRVTNYQFDSFFQLQDDIVIQLVQMLKEEIQPQTQQLLLEGGTHVSQAYEHYLQAKGYLSQYQDVQKNIDIAIDQFQTAIQMDSSFALAFAGLGEAYWKKYKSTKINQWVDSSRYYCARALKISERLAPVHITLGMVKSGTGQYKEAIGHYKQALDLDPVNADAYRGLANNYAKTNQIDLAETTFKKAIGLKSGNWKNYNSLGVFYYQQGRYQEAAEQFKQSAALTPDNAKAYNNLGSMYFFLNNYEEAIKTYEQSLQIEQSYIAYANLGTLYYFKGNFKNAAAMFEKALEISPNDYRLWGNLASSYAQIPGYEDKMTATYEKSIALVEKALLVDPNDIDVLSSLANYNASIGNNIKAISIAQKIESLNPTSVNIFCNLCEIYEQVGERSKAIEWITKAVEKGYSIEKIQRTPELKDLCRDERFIRLVSNMNDPG